MIKYSKKQAESMKFLEWFIQEDVQKKWADLGGYTCNAQVLKSDEFRKATPYNEAFYQTMFMVKDFWAVPEYAELLDSMNKRLHPYIVGDKGTAEGSAGRCRQRLGQDLQKYGRSSKSSRRGRASGFPPRPAIRRQKTITPSAGGDCMLARLDPGSASAKRGMSDIAIRNLFIIPTIVFLIVFNIFPLLYSLGYSFTDFRASSIGRGEFRRAGQLSRTARRRIHLEQLHDHRQVRAGFGRRAGARRVRRGAAAQPQGAGQGPASPRC